MCIILLKVILKKIILKGKFNLFIFKIDEYDFKTLNTNL